MNRLLELLQDGCFHSGQELGDSLDVSRSSVWKCLQRIESDFGISLYKVKGRGYRLVEPLSLLDEANLKQRLDAHGWALYFHDSIDSTNAEALRLLQAQAQAPFVVLAERQTSGRGRRGRRWVSPTGQNLYFSLALKIVNGPQQLSGMSLVVGLAVMQALRRQGITSAGLKWPNDIYAGGKKLAGILLEVTGDPADVCHVVIGIGVNTNMTSTHEAIDQPWTSMRAETGGLIDRNELTDTVCDSLRSYLDRHAVQGFSSLRDEWETNHVWQGKSCRLSTGGEEVIGVVLGVDNQGAIRLLVSGQEKVYSGGELSLRLDHDS